MKKYSSIIYIVGLACAGLIFTGCATNQASAPIPPNSGHLVINRVANFGSDLSLVVSVDGKNMWEALARAEVTVAIWRQVSSTIVVQCDPNPGGKRPGRLTLTVPRGADIPTLQPGPERVWLW